MTTTISESTSATDSSQRPLVLWASADGGGHWFTVTFTGPDESADVIAASYIARHGADLEAGTWGYCFQVDGAESDNEGGDYDWERFPLVYDALWPTCEHGLSERLCMGPMHYPCHEQEMEMGWGY